MSTLHVLSGLIEKRRELDALIRDVAANLKQLRADLGHIRGANRVIEPGFDFADVRPKRLPPGGAVFKSGELGWLVHAALRGSPEPLKIRQVMSAVLAAKGLSVGDEFPSAEIERRVECAMRKRDGRTLERVPMAGRAVGWRVL